MKLIRCSVKIGSGYTLIRYYKEFKRPANSNKNFFKVCRGKGLCEHNNGGNIFSLANLEPRDLFPFQAARILAVLLTILFSAVARKGLFQTQMKGRASVQSQRICVGNYQVLIIEYNSWKTHLIGCSCGSVDDSQFICTCPPYGEKCLLLKGIPKIYLDPFPPYEVGKLKVFIISEQKFQRLFLEPGGTLNISCAAVGK